MPKPRIILWRIMMENENKEIVGFNYDIPFELSDQIDVLIEEYYQVEWEK